MATLTSVVRKTVDQQQRTPGLFLLIVILLSLFVFSEAHSINVSLTHAKTEHQILSWSGDGTVRVWDAERGDELLTLKHEAKVRGAVWNSNGNQILSWSDDKTARVWDATTGDNLHLLRHEDRVISAVWNRDESQILTSSSDGHVYLWNAVTGKKLNSLISAPSMSGAFGASGANWNADESLILSWVWWWGNPTGTIYVWDVTAGKEIVTLAPKRRLGAKWNREGDLILVLDSPSVLNAASGQEVFPVKRQRAAIIGASWNADESQILFWLDDGTWHIWDATTGEEKLKIRHGKGKNYILSAVWNESGNQIISCAEDDTARVWDAVTGEEKLTLTHERTVNGAVWNSNANQILSWSNDGTARIWDAATGEQLHEFRHDDIVWGAVWNEDEIEVLTWSEDRTIRVWNAATGEQKLLLQHDGVVYGAVWSRG